MLKAYCVKNKETEYSVLSTLCEFHAKELDTTLEVTVIINTPPDVRCDICNMIRNAPQPKLEDV